MFATRAVFPINVDAQGRKLQVTAFSRKCCPNALHARRVRCVRFSQDQARKDVAADRTANGRKRLTNLYCFAFGRTLRIMTGSVLLDLDGTLIDSHPGILASCLAAL